MVISSSHALARRFARYSWLSFIALSISSPGAFAQQDTSQTAGPSIILQDVLVTSPTTVPTPESDVASSISVITSRQIAENQWRTVPDALNSVPGLNVVQTGGPGGVTSVFIRGTNANHVKVLIDGIDVSDPSNVNDSFDFGQLLTGDIERIEILRGPQSGLYGSDAIGGVINIVTKKGQGPLKMSGTVEGGSFGTLNQNLHASGSESIFNYMFNLDHWHSASTPVTPLNELQPGETRNNDSYDNLTFSTKLGADFNEHVSLNYVGRYTTSTYNFTGDSLDPTTFLYFPSPTQSQQVDHNYYTRGELVTSFFDNRLKNYLGFNYSDSWSLNTTPGSPTENNEGKRPKVDWRSVIQALPGETVVIGADHQKDSLWEINPDGNASQSDTGVFAELQSNFYNHIFMASNVRYDDYDTFGSHVTYRLPPSVILPGIETKLKASYGTGFKAPTLNELFVSYPAYFFYGNPNLLPEESTGYDFGFEQPILNNKVRFGVTYFHNDITNLIQSTFTTYINVGHAETQGIESFAEWAVTDRLHLRTDYTFTRATDESTGFQLQRVPEDKGSLSVLWTPLDPVTLSATLVAVSKWVDDYDRNNANTAPGNFAPGYAVVNVAANYKVNDRLSLFGRVDNLTNTHYEDPLGFLRPGIGVFGGMKVTAF